MPLSGNFKPASTAFPDDGEPPSIATLDGKAAHSNTFLRCHRVGFGYDTTWGTSEILLISFDHQSARSDNCSDGECLAAPDLAEKYRL